MEICIIKIAYCGLTRKVHLIKSMAIGETSSNNSSGNVSAHFEIFKNVSCFVSPPNGLHPVNKTYVSTPMDHMSVFNDSGSYCKTSGAT